MGALSLCTVCATFCVSHKYLTVDLALQSTYQLRERGYGISQYVKVSPLSVKNKTSLFSTFFRLFPIFFLHSTVFLSWLAWQLVASDSPESVGSTYISHTSLVSLHMFFLCLEYYWWRGTKISHVDEPNTAHAMVSKSGTNQADQMDERFFRRNRPRVPSKPAPKNHSSAQRSCYVHSEQVWKDHPSDKTASGRGGWGGITRDTSRCAKRTDSRRGTTSVAGKSSESPNQYQSTDNKLPTLSLRFSRSWFYKLNDPLRVPKTAMQLRFEGFGHSWGVCIYVYIYVYIYIYIYT